MIVLCIAATTTHSQTIEEITALQRKKLVSDLTKEIGSPAAPPAAPAMSAPPPKRAPERPVLVGVSGDPNDASRLTATVVEGDRPAMDYRVGDTTSEGWRLERVGRREAEFSRQDGARTVRMSVKYDGSPAQSAIQRAVPAAMAKPVPTPAIGGGN